MYHWCCYPYYFEIESIFKSVLIDPGLLGTLRYARSSCGIEMVEWMHRNQTSPLCNFQ